MVHKSIGIIGSKGFIGSNLVQYLNGVDASTNCSFKTLINAAGNSKKYLPNSDPIEDFELNVKNTLEFLLDFYYDLYIHISSCEVYGDLSKDNTDENAVIDVSKLSRYGLSKYLSECIVKNYCKKYIILRLNGPLGENMSKGPIHDIRTNGKLWVSAESKFQFIHTSFIAKFIKHLIHKEIFNETINLTGTGNVSLKEVMKVFNREVEYPDSPAIEHKIKVDKANSIMKVPTSSESLYECK